MTPIILFTILIVVANLFQGSVGAIALGILCFLMWVISIVRYLIVMTSFNKSKRLTINDSIEIHYHFGLIFLNILVLIMLFNHGFITTVLFATPVVIVTLFQVLLVAIKGKKRQPIVEITSHKDDGA